MTGGWHRLRGFGRCLCFLGAAYQPPQPSPPKGAAKAVARALAALTSARGLHELEVVPCVQVVEAFPLGAGHRAEHRVVDPSGVRAGALAAAGDPIR
jgi:hypothetical protein